MGVYAHRPIYRNAIMGGKKYMKTLDEITRLLEQYKPEFQEKYRLKEIGIFGSYARGEETGNSDIDILVEFDDAPDLLTFLEFESYVEKILDIETDMVRKKAIRTELKDEILRDVVYL